MTIIGTAGIAAASGIPHAQGAVRWVVIVVLSFLVVAAQLGGELSKRQAVQDARFKIELTLDPQPSELQTFDGYEEFVQALLRKEREERLASLGPKETEPKSSVSFDASKFGGGPTIDEVESYQRRRDEGAVLTPYELSQLHQFEKTMSTLSKAISGSFTSNMLSNPDKRTEEQFRDEVESYIDTLHRYIGEKIDHNYRVSGFGLMRITLVNPTERTFERVQLEVNVSGKTHLTLGSGDEDLSVPEPPRPFGQRDPLNYGTGFLHPAVIDSRMFLSSPKTDPFGIEISNDKSSSASAKYPWVTLRPRGHAQLDDVYIFTGGRTGTTVEVTWSATAVNADGRVTAEFAVPVGPKVDVRSLFSDPA